MATVVTKKYNLNNSLNKKIVLISDIHYYSKKDIIRLNKVLDTIKKLNPDYICITGDITDKQTIEDFDLLLNWLNKLSNICKIFISLGNHEFYVDKKRNLYKLNNEYLNKIKSINNIFLLDNNNMIIDGINFIGLTLPISHYTNNNESKKDFMNYIKYIKTNKKYYNILLCHSPINISKKEVLNKVAVDLVLCGHMHGGIVPRIFRFIFGNYGLISPHKKLFPKNAYGKINIDNKIVIITSGIKVLSESHLPNFINVFASEVVEINL